MDGEAMVESFSQNPPPLPPWPSHHVSYNADEIPLIPVTTQFDSGKDRSPFQKPRRKPVPSKELIRASLFKDPEAPSSAEEYKSTSLPPKRFKRKRTWRNWRRPLKQAGIFIALGGAIVIFVLLPKVFNSSNYNSFDYNSFPIAACQGFGYAAGAKWTFVGIDIRIGQMSFGLAKAADLAFNWGAGRGLQVVLAWLSYRVFTDALMRTTEMTYVPYDLFTSLALYSTKTDALWQLSKALHGIPGWRVKAIFGWLLFSTAYLAAFPSLIDAMSGYEASMTTGVMLPNNSMFVVGDDAWVDLGPLMFNNCTDNTSISHMSTSACWEFYDETLQRSFDAYYSSDTALFYTQIPGNVVCRTDQHLYHWGFSAEWLLVVACVNSFWLFGLWILWLDADTQSQLCKKGRRMGIYRAIADVAEVMREDLGPNLCAYSEAELTAAVRKQGPIKYYVSDENADGVAHIGLSSRPSTKVKLSWEQEYGCYQE